MNDDARAVLDWWFETLPASKRFARDADIDKQIAERFGAVHTRMAQAVPDDWRTDARALLAAIIVLDQFSRNLFRDDQRAFANDAAALALTETAIANGWDVGLSSEERQFLYMPLMHSEQRADVERCVVLMTAAGSEGGAEFARKHAATIARFGRYPARNAALGRATTPEEASLLRDNPAGFVG
jgi:uncharacterized protein (DUF924 family)